MTTMKIPKTLAACADLYYMKRESRREMQRQVDELEVDEKKLKEHLINNLPKSDASGVAGKLCRVSVVSKLVPQLKDDSLFFPFVKKSGRFDLLQRRLSESAIQELWESGKKVPGVEAFNVVTLSVNKL